MTWLFTLLAMAVIALVAGVVTGRIAGAMEAPESSLPFRGLPPGDVDPGDLERLRFDAALRGYRMDQVDEVLDRLVGELHRRDDEIAALRAELAGELHRAAYPSGEPYELDGAYSPGQPYQPGVDYPVPEDDPAFAPPAGAVDLRGRPDPAQD